MKKYFALFLALIILLLCAACGKTTTNTETIPPSSEPSEISDSAEVEAIGDVQGPVLIEESTGEGFSCLILDNSECYWAVGLVTPEQVESYFSIKAAPRTYIQFVPISYTDDPITDADAVWQMQVVGDEIPDWFLEEEEYQQIAWASLEEWRAVAYTAEPVTAVNVETITINEETGEGFACVLRKDGKVFWKQGVNYPSQIVELNGLEEVSKLLIQVVQIGEGDNSWQIQIIGDEIPTWFTSVERMEFNVRDALETWKTASKTTAEDNAGTEEEPADPGTNEEEN